MKIFTGYRQFAGSDALVGTLNARWGNIVKSVRLNCVNHCSTAQSSQLQVNKRALGMDSIDNLRARESVQRIHQYRSVLTYEFPRSDLRVGINAGDVRPTSSLRREERALGNEQRTGHAGTLCIVFDR